MTIRPYAEAAARYMAAGWANPIPIHGDGGVLLGKRYPPTGYTGYDGANVSWPDMQAWIDGREGGHNIALRLPGDVVGIDVDDHDGKVGAQTIAKAEAKLGPLPPAPRSTSRDPGGRSGIRVYRVPSGMNLKGAEKRFANAFGEHVDILRRDHRYVMSWPSVHPDTGETYHWYGSDGERIAIPRPADLLDLPQAWVDFLAVPAAAAPPPSVTPGAPSLSPWDLPRQFTREQAIEFIAPAFESLRTAPNGTINNRLNTAAVTLGHFVPAFWDTSTAEGFLLHALKDTAYDGRTWRAETTIRSGLGAKTWRAELLEPVAAEEADTEPETRIVDLGPFLDGTYVPPVPCVGAERDDNKYLLYPSRWHTVVGLTAAGKSWLALWHAKRTMATGGTVVYLHFEEAMPTGTLARLRKMGCTPELIRERFIWLDCSRRWSFGDLSPLLGELNEVTLVVLDGINAACSSHGWPVDKPEAIGAYRAMFVTPAASRGAAVLSLGHPPKGRDRQGERHGFGSTAWLDEVDGVAFRLEASKTPIGRGRLGRSSLYSVKDRYGEVEAAGLAEEKREAGWYYQGSLEVDDTVPSGTTVIRLSTPSISEAPTRDALDDLGAAVVTYLRSVEGQNYSSHKELGDAMRARSVAFRNGEITGALTRLEMNGLIIRDPYVRETSPRGGRLASPREDLDDDND